jgi:hypothetical protein
LFPRCGEALIVIASVCGSAKRIADLGSIIAVFVVELL